MSEKSTEPVVLVKSYERDTSLIIEGPWARAFVEFIPNSFDIPALHPPFVVFYVTEDSLQIWEHEKALKAFMDALLAKNSKDTQFLEAVITEYKELRARLEEYVERGATTDKEQLIQYQKLIQKGAGLVSLWYYTALDDRTPDQARNLALEVRATDEFFARNDAFIKNCIEMLGGDRTFANFILPEEFPDLPDMHVLEERARGFISIDGIENSISSLQDLAARNPTYEFKNVRNEDDRVAELSGQVAYSGKVLGKARIVKNRNQMEALEKGEVMVSPMTTPDFLPAMQRAAAFVTDEGGITCHAAIVAREMKKPCVIGTKFATQVLKTGDLVEVDANEGIVRILEKAT